MLINKREAAGIKHFNDSEVFIEYSNDTDDLYKTIEEYNLKKKKNIDMIADMLSNPIVTELIIRERKLNISRVFITQFYFSVPKKF